MPDFTQTAFRSTAAGPGVAAVPVSPDVPSLKWLRWLLVAYIALWVFEGALRKWILPGLANPLLIIRDPVLLLLYVMALSKGVFPQRAIVGWIIGLGAVAFAVSFAGTNVPLLIQLYGLRADYFHLPLIFLMPQLFDRDDIRKAGKYILLVGVPMAVLVTLQFVSSGSAFLNRGAGGGDGGMLESAYGHIRPSGTFSFTNGLTGFTSLVVAFFLHHLLEGKVYSKWLWLATGPVLIVLITLSGSRVAVGLAGLIMASVVFICLMKARYWQPALKLIVLGGLAFVALGSFAVFKDGLEVFAYRFGDSSNVRVGFFGRFIESLTTPYNMLSDLPSGGLGLGMGTNVAGALLTGKRAFLIAEGELPRVLLESGGIVGTAFILLRAAIDVCLGWAALVSLQRHANTLPMLIFAGSFLDILQGQFAQPTGLGYAVVAGGLCLAASRMPAPKADAPIVKAAPAAPLSAGRINRLQAPPGTPASAPATAEPPVAATAPAAPIQRGRSAYAERLHGTSEDK